MKYVCVSRKYIEDLEWLKDAAEDMLAEYLAGELGKPCPVGVKKIGKKVN